MQAQLISSSEIYFNKKHGFLLIYISLERKWYFRKRFLFANLQSNL